MVYAHRRTLDDPVIVNAFAVAAVFVMLIAGLRMRGSVDASTKIVTLILSFMWASQGVKMFQETCGGAG
jgi:hypothetical protein